LDRETLMVTGLILFVAGTFFLLAYLPTYTSLYNQINGIETPEEPLTKSDYGFYITLSSVLMPFLISLTAIGATLLLLGVFTREKK